jgi:hypothetical protein
MQIIFVLTVLLPETTNTIGYVRFLFREMGEKLHERKLSLMQINSTYLALPKLTLIDIS